jgi:pimeloyl-ACP methyl ester carboxylesterase
MSDFRESFVTADDVRIRYLEAGQGSPVVHLHGAGGLMLTWRTRLRRQSARWGWTGCI